MYGDIISCSIDTYDVTFPYAADINYAIIMPFIHALGYIFASIMLSYSIFFFMFLF